MKRREFLGKNLMMSSATLIAPRINFNFNKKKFSAVSFGVCTDIHQDLYPNVPRRLKKFVDEMQERNADFIIQLGDFCMPYSRNQEIIDIFNQFSNPKLHVLGNHDAEKIFTREEVVEFWGAKSKYYSVDINGYHLVVLDGNEVNPSPFRNCEIHYNRYISQKQLEWLEEDIDNTRLPTIIFIHQSLDHDTGIENSDRIRAFLNRCNQKEGWQKILMVISGHHHLDYYNVINGIHHIQINSMCYKWQGDRFAESPYDEVINKKYPLLSKMSHYEDSLYAFFEISKEGLLKITGKESNFLGSSPQELGMPEFFHSYPVVPKISDREIHLS